MQLPPVPDALALMALPGLYTEDLNTVITGSYAVFARHIEHVAHAGFDGQPRGRRPVWFTIAVWASRQVGVGMYAAGVAHTQVGRLVRGTDPRRLLQEVAPDLSDGLCDELMGVLRWADEEAFLIAVFLLQLIRGRDDAGNLEALADPRTLVICLRRMIALVASAPDPTLHGRLQRVATTARNLLTDGNRRIFTDIGAAATAWLRLRETGRWSPEEVVDRLAPPASRALVRRRFEQARELARGHDAADVWVGRWDGITAGPETLVPAFGLYEEAGRDPVHRAQLIHTANQLIAWQEQFVSVHPAFVPGRVLAGEVDRVALFDVLTSTVQLPTHAAPWRFARWAQDGLPARDRNPLTPRVTEYNWSAFEDRWTPILGAFREFYGRPEDLWPMPAVDPRVG
jgi:hypothetical protein